MRRPNVQPWGEKARVRAVIDGSVIEQPRVLCLRTGEPARNRLAAALAFTALGLAFPNTCGGVDDLPHIVQRTLHSAMIAAGLVTADGKPRYTGMLGFDTPSASWCTNRKAYGGLELPLKTVRARLGARHDRRRYGHLFSRGEDGEELADAAKALLG